MQHPPEQQKLKGKKAAIAAAKEKVYPEYGENEIDESIGEDGLSLPPYPENRLRRWKPAPSVEAVEGKPGEMGELTSF